MLERTASWSLAPALAIACRWRLRFETLKQEWISPFKQYRIRSLEKKLEDYKEPQAMYKAQGSNAFTKAYRKTMTLDDKLKANIERRNKLTERLTQLRGG